MKELQARSFIDKNFHAAFNKKHGTDYSQDELQSAFEKMIGEVPMDTPVTDTMIMKVLKKNESVSELIESDKPSEEIVDSIINEGMGTIRKIVKQAKKQGIDNWDDLEQMIRDDFPNATGADFTFARQELGI